MLSFATYITMTSSSFDLSLFLWKNIKMSISFWFSLFRESNLIFGFWSEKNQEIYFMQIMNNLIEKMTRYRIKITVSSSLILLKHMHSTKTDKRATTRKWKNRWIRNNFSFLFIFHHLSMNALVLFIKALFFYLLLFWKIAKTTY